MSEYYMKITDLGLALITDSIALGISVNLTNFGVGDSDGVYYDPDSSMTALVNELWKSDLNRVSIDPENSLILICEGKIPMDHSAQYASDFTIMEVGIYADDGTGNEILFAIGKTPSIPKPLITSGSGVDTYVRCHLLHSNISVVNLQIDDDVTTATRNYVDEEVKKIKITDDVSFHSSVETGKPVYYNGSTNQYELALADGTIAQEVEGFANVELGFVVAFGQFVGLGSVLDGEIYYLSSSVAGELVTTPPNNYIVQLGKGLPNNILHVNIQQFSYREKRLTISNSYADMLRLQRTQALVDNYSWELEITGAINNNLLRFLTETTPESGIIDKTVLVLESSGNVGIGIEAPTEKLHVVGNVLIDGTLVAPIIASMINANHNHADAVGGGILGASALSGILGDWTANDPNNPANPLADNTSYYAPTDGFVAAYNTLAANVSFYTDAANPPTVERTRNQLPTGNPGLGCLVKKGHYWKVTNSSVRFWMPIGV